MRILKLLTWPFRRLATMRKKRAAEIWNAEFIKNSRYFYLGPEMALTRLKSGFLMYVDPQDETVSANLIVHGEWEPQVSRIVRRLTAPGASVVEVGANLGYYTLLMARAVGENGRVLALEANPRLAGLARRSVHFNGYSGRVRLEAKAAADQAGELSFMTSRRHSGSGHTLVPESAICEDDMVTVVEAVPLDDIAPEKVDFIRLDAEGSEPLILKGATRLLADPDIVVCMEWGVIQMRSRTDVPQFVAWLAGQGFRFWKIELNATLTPVPSELMATLEHCDVVMARKPPVHAGVNA